MPELLSNWDLSCGVFIKDKNIFLDCKNAFIFHHFKPKTNLTWHNISFSRSKKDLESDLCCKKCISIKALKTCKKDQSHLYSVVQSTLLKVELKEQLFGKINCRIDDELRWFLKQFNDSYIYSTRWQTEMNTSAIISIRLLCQIRQGKHKWWIMHHITKNTNLL